MSKLEYEQLWDKIRSIENDFADVIIANSYGDLRKKICDSFMNMHYLNLHYIQGKSSMEIALEKNIPQREVCRLIKRELSIIKVMMAENNIFEEKNFKNNSVYFEYLRKRISDKGVAFVHVNDEVPVSHIAFAIGVKSDAVHHTITENRRIIRGLLAHKGITPTKKCVDIYIKVFGGYYDSYDQIPDNYLEKLNTLIKSIPFLNKYVYKYLEHSEEEKEKCEQTLYEVEKEMRKILNKRRLKSVSALR